MYRLLECSFMALTRASKVMPILVASVVLLSAMPAEACHRCGLFGRKCRFVQQPLVLADQFAYDSYSAGGYQAAGQTIIFNNAIAQPPLLAPQASTLYGVQSSAQAYMLNPDAALNLAKEYLNQSAETRVAALALSDSGAEILRQQGNVALALAAMQANSAPPAGTSSVVRSQSFTVRQQNGQVTVESTNQAGTQNGFTCAKCHSGPNAKDGLVFDGKTLITCEQVLRGIGAINAGKMPKGVSLDAVQRLEHIDALTRLVLVTDPVPPEPPAK